MSKNLLPSDFVRQLNENPNIQSATEWSVSFTAEFKQFAYDELLRGKSIREIFTESGIDCDILGAKRLDNFRHNLIRESQREAGFADKRLDKNLQSPPSTEAQLLKRIRELEHRNEYLSQENDFLKKIRNAEKACARKAVKPC